MSKKIVVMEDDAFSKEYYKYILNKKGFEPIVFEEGDRLMEILDGEKVHLVIMDINLKNTYLHGEKVDGIYLSRMIKEHLIHRKIPVLLVTAYSLSADGPSFIEESLADDYITKPIIDVKILMDKILLLMEKYEQK